MKPKRSIKTPIWVGVKVIRGFVAEAQLFCSQEDARRTVRKWQRTMNPDYDEVGIVESSAPRKTRRRQRQPHRCS
jgi:hypothetical protein